MAESQENKYMFSDSLLLAAATFAGTVVAIIFEHSYLSYYGIPASIIQLDLMRIVAAAAAVSMYLIVMILLLFVGRASSAHSNPFRRAMITPLVLSIMIGPFLFFSIRSEYRIFIIIGLAMMVYFICLIVPFFTRKRGETYLEKLGASDNNFLKVEYTDKYYENFAGPLSLILFFSFIVVGAGREHAASKISYAVVSGQDKVVIEIYGDTVVLKEFDPTTKTLKKGFEFVRMSSLDVLKLETLSVGPLSRAN